MSSSFATGICNWCPGEEGCKTCICATFCPCIQYGWNSELLDPGEAPCAGKGNFWAACGVYCGLYAIGGITAALTGVGIGCQWVVHMQTREAIRKKYNLKTEPCNDCCTAFCCGPCALCQEYHQLTGPHNKTGAGPVPVPPSNPAQAPAAMQNPQTSYPAAPPPPGAYPPPPQAYSPAQAPGAPQMAYPPPTYQQ